MSPPRIVLDEQGITYLLAHANAMFPNSKIDQMKLVRGITGLGISEGKTLIEDGARRRLEAAQARGNFLHGEHPRQRYG